MKEGARVLLPLLVALWVWTVGPQGAEGRFQVVVAAMCVAAALEAFPRRTARAVFRAPTQGVVLLALLLGLGASLETALTQGALLVGVALAAGGLAALGRGVGAGWVGAGAVGLALVCVAMSGLFWADDLAAGVPLERRPALRQAVLHLDPATAAAYAEPGFDRLRSRPEIYRDVPLASTLIAAPQPAHTAAAWLLLAAALAGAARLCPRPPESL